MSPPLKPGHYLIQSVATGKYIGRNSKEDRSLRPKPVLQLPDSVDPHPWIVEKLPDGDSYILRARGAPTAAVDGDVYAILLDVPLPEFWKISSPERNPNDEYIIETNNRTRGWAVPGDEDFIKIAVRPLIVGPSFPPFYPPNQVFKFIPVERDDASE
ncbi:hypothetical protein BXZ70DRAFT_459676 [Cristinia sonorae]|uniref:Serine protease inhibitor n=1 Tax=Cristinia sonorae TaxID=1940300 RepID=A0A8K0UHV8_9AGAR|nr:hypothetical protein BXZ70DRAFT_459676 [Cristinia sonorae]